MPEQNSGGVPVREPERLIKWFVGVVVMGVVVNVLSGFVVAQKWAWLPPAVFVAALLVAVSSTGLLRRERYGTTRSRAMALLALAGYLTVTVWGAVTGWPLAVMILSLAYLWEAGVMVLWSTLRSRADLDHVAMGTACLLVGSAFLLLGIANPLHASTLGMVAGLLARAAFLLLGVAALSGVAALLAGWTLMGVAFLLCGFALLLGGAAALLAGWKLVGVPFLLFGVAALLGSVAALLAGWTPVGVAFVLLGIAALLGGAALLYRPELPRQLIAWLTKQDDLPLTANGGNDWNQPYMVNRIIAAPRPSPASI